MGYLFIYYTKEPRDPKYFESSQIQLVFEHIVELAKKGAKFAVYEVGGCIGDFS